MMRQDEDQEDGFCHSIRMLGEKVSNVANASSRRQRTSRDTTDRTSLVTQNELWSVTAVWLCGERVS